ncbi:MAG: HAD family phosphatase [Planctomycetes bacterium]|nr:HAD family phosphatase [Planctomycetota bacterium]
MTRSRSLQAATFRRLKPAATAVGFMHTIIFDFGNVVGLFDHGRTLGKLAAYTDMPPERIFAEIYCGVLEEEFESGRIGQAEFLRLFRNRCRLRCDEADLARAIADIFEPNPEVCDLIPQLKKRYSLLLGSNTNPIHATHYRRQFAQVLRHFDDLILSHEIGERKPRPGFFQECVRRAACEPCRCLFIDDVAENVEGAIACGLKGLHYVPGDLCPRLRSAGIHLPEKESGSIRS